MTVMLERHPLRRGQCRVAGFTLVELLVVLAILLVLVALLLPALGRARAASRLLTCSNNLRTIAQASFNYASANRGELPGDGWPRGTDWFPYRLSEYLGGPAMRDPDRAMNDDLHLYVDLPVFRCPAFPKDWSPPDYAVNCFEFQRIESYLAWTRAQVVGAYVPRDGQKLGKIPRPAELGYYFEKSVGPGPRGQGCGPLQGNLEGAWHPSLTTFDAGGVANATPNMIEARDTRHFGRTPVAFFDGHVEVRHLTPGDLPLRLFDPMQWNAP
jgi:prepilin-type N-terminal cleavage/methylation domain-containing protein/prepilin-type processing-associated H-X9-DG protein